MTIVSGLALHKCARGDTVNAASLWLPSKLSTVCWNSIGFMFFFKDCSNGWTVCPHCNSLALFWEKSESWQFGVNEIPFGVLPALYYNYTLCDYTFLLPRTLLLCCLIWSFYSLLMSSLYVFFLALLSETFFEPNGVYLDSLVWLIRAFILLVF